MKRLITLVNIFLSALLIYFSKIIFEYKFFNEKIVKVPDVVGLDKDNATRILESVNLSALYISTKSYDEPLNYVISQKPKADEKVKIHRAISLYVNEDKENKLPKLVGLNINEATKVLKQANIDIERIDYIASKDSENKVIAVYPSEKARLEYGAKISLLVTTQKLEDFGKMPNIIGLDINDALNILKEHNLNVSKIKYVKEPDLLYNSVVETIPKPDDILNSKDVYIVINESENKKSDGE